MNKFSLAAFVFLTGFLFNSCKDDDFPTENNQVENKNYFPSSEGNFYKYNTEISDPNGTNSGTRSTRYSNSNQQNGIYKLQVDSLSLNGNVSTSNSFFRTTDAGVYYFLDTTGFASNLSPDIIQYLPFLTFDNEMILLSFPFQDGKSWTVFKVNASIQGFNITLVDAEASYLGKENFTLKLLSGNTNKEATKIRYNLTIRTNPSSQDSEEFSATAWIVEDIGVVKWEGNGLLLNLFTSGEINLADTSSIITQNLIDFSLNE